MRNNESTLSGLMFFPDDDTSVLGFGCLYSNYWTGKWTGTMEWTMEVSKSIFHRNIQFYCVVIYLLTHS